MSLKYIATSESRRGLFRRAVTEATPTGTPALPSESLGARLLDYGISRRGFMQFCAGMASLMALPPSTVQAMVSTLLDAPKKPSVIYMSFQECTGCLESLVNSGPVGFLSGPLAGLGLTEDASKVENLILDIISLNYQETIMAASGAAAEALRNKLIKENRGKFVLVVDGSIPVPDPSRPETFGYFVSGGQSGVARFVKAARHAEAIVAVGTCASFGGLPHAQPNPTGAVSVHEVMEMHGIEKTLVTLPGCPPIAEVITGVLLYYFLNKSDPVTYPLEVGNGLDELYRPTVLYGSTVHGQQCDRFTYYRAGSFAKSFDDDPFSPALPSGARQGHCLLELGCKGPMTHNACTTVKWNQGTGYPMKSGHGCIGCSEPNFWDGYYPRVYDPVAGRPVAQKLTWNAVKDPAQLNFKASGFYDQLEDPSEP